MVETYDVSAKVISVEGTCEQGHEVGDEWIIKDDKTPGGICGGAFCSIFPEARVLSFGATPSIKKGHLLYVVGDLFFGLR